MVVAIPEHATIVAAGAAEQDEFDFRTQMSVLGYLRMAVASTLGFVVSTSIVASVIPCVA